MCASTVRAKAWAKLELCFPKIGPFNHHADLRKARKTIIFSNEIGAVRRSALLAALCFCWLGWNGLFSPFTADVFMVQTKGGKPSSPQGLGRFYPHCPVCSRLCDSWAPQAWPGLLTAAGHIHTGHDLPEEPRPASAKAALTCQTVSTLED